MSHARALAGLVGLAVVGWLVWETGPRALWAQFQTVGWRLPLLLLPNALGQLLDSVGWRWAFPGRVPSFRRLVAARLAGEAVNATTPTATLGGEPLKAWLASRNGPPFEEAFASVVVAKTAVVVAHLGFVALAVALAVWRLPRAAPLVSSVAALAAAGVAAVGGFLWTQQRGLFSASTRALAWLGLGGSVAGRAARVDAQLAAFYRERRGRFLLSVLFHALGWGAGSLEVWVALRLLGTPVDAATAVVIEGFATAIRSAGFLVPASLGVQEGGLIGIFHAFGLGADLGLAVALLRRLREAVWALAGYALLAAWGVPAPAEES